MNALVWYLVAIVIDVNGVANSQVLSEHHLLSECFEEREVVLWTAQLSDPNERMKEGLQLVCVARQHKTT